MTRSIKEIFPEVENSIREHEERKNPHYSGLTGQIFVLTSEGSAILNSKENDCLGGSFCVEDELAHDRGLGVDDNPSENLIALRVIYIGGIFQKDAPTILVNINDQLFG